MIRQRAAARDTRNRPIALFLPPVPLLPGCQAVGHPSRGWLQGALWPTSVRLLGEVMRAWTAARQLQKEQEGGPRELQVGQPHLYPGKGDGAAYPGGHHEASGGKEGYQE